MAQVTHDRGGTVPGRQLVIADSGWAPVSSGAAYNMDDKISCRRSAGPSLETSGKHD